MNDSGDISSIISKLTENPEMMKSLMGIAGNLMNSNNDNGGKSEAADNYGNQNSPRDISRDKGYEREEEKHHGDVQTNHRKRGDDAENLIRLLLALKPYVGPDRCEKIDSIVKILKLVQLSEKTGLLKSLL